MCGHPLAEIAHANAMVLNGLKCTSGGTMMAGERSRTPGASIIPASRCSALIRADQKNGFF
jgi:hypothetical protein